MVDISNDEGDRIVAAFLRSESELLVSQDRSAEPICDYVAAQRNKGPYHLPEPISHPTWKPAVLVVGLNPSYWEDEPDIPRASGDFRQDVDACVAFYGTRFEAKPLDKTHLHGKLELLLTETFRRKWGSGGVAFTDRALGIRGGAVLCDAIPWKWAGGVGKKGLGRNLNERDWKIARERVRRIVDALRPRIVLSLGVAVGGKIIGWEPGYFGAIPQAQDPQPHGFATTCPILHIAAYHPTGSWGEFAKHREALIGAIRGALPDDPSQA